MIACKASTAAYEAFLHGFWPRVLTNVALEPLLRERDAGPASNAVMGMRDRDEAATGWARRAR